MENRNSFYKMSKQITHIGCPGNWQSANDYDSHRPLLWLALKNTKGKVVEFGMGHGSTPLLDKECYIEKRMFSSWETNDDWYNMMVNKCIMETTSLGHATNYFNEIIEKDNGDIGLLFVDCAPAEIRKELINKYSEIAKVIVVHDSEIGAEYVYGMSEILSTFKYRVDYQPQGKPHTTAVSNFINIEEWVK